MNPETVLTMCTEKSIDINHIPGGHPNFTSEDAKHALSHMKPDAFNYCQYVFLLYGDESLAKLIENTVHVVVKDCNLAKKDKGLTFVVSLCRMACEEQIKNGKRISDTSRCKRLDISRGEWRYTWKDVFYTATNYLNGLNSDVAYHIYKNTKEE